MKLKFLIGFSVVFHLIPFIYGQNNRCAFTSDSLIPLRLTYDIDLEKGEYVISVKKNKWEPIRHDHILLYSESHGSFYALNESDPLSVYSYNMGEIDSSDILGTINLDQVTSMTISVNAFTQEKLIDFEIFRDLPIINQLSLKNLNEINIIISNTGNQCEINIGLSGWENYENLRKNNLLESFTFQDYRNQYTVEYSPNKNIIEDLSVFSNLKKLEIPIYLNKELLLFPHLETLFFFNTEYFFAQHFTDLKLKYPIYRTNDWRNFIQNNTQRMYFLNQGNHAIDTVEIGKKYDFNNPNTGKFYNVTYLDSIIKLANGSGQFTVLRKDLYSAESYHTRLRNDTLWHGQLKNGKMIGKWKIYDEQNETYILIDFDKIGSYEIPENGSFKYYFPNGQLGIEGKMKNGYKQGVWKFYELDGKLASIKTFKNDHPLGLFIDYSFDSQSKMYSESRRYYKNDLEYIYMLLDDSYSIPNLAKNGPNIGRTYSIWPHEGNKLVLWDFEKGEIDNYTIEDSEYCQIIYKEFLKKLYPRTRKKDIPFINCFCDN